MRILGRCLLVVALLATPAGAAELDLAPQARALAGVVACVPGAVAPPRFDAKVLAAHCRQLAMLQRWWKSSWLSRAQPFLDKVVPTDLPPRLVYPFGGGDLLSALATFPRAAEIITLSLEPSGDVRSIDAIDAQDLDGALADVRDMARRLFAVAHSKTSTMSKMAHAKFPGELSLALIALTMNDLEPVSLRYFRVGPDGELHYLEAADLDAVATAPPAARAQLFANVEIEFRPRAGGATRVFRHISANLDDAHLTADPAVLRYLERQGTVAVMTKAASYLLWWRNFSQMRGYLLGHMVWMISDSTGIPPEYASAAGFEQIPYGHFEGSFLKTADRPSQAFQRLWAGSAKPISFPFGYDDINGNAHLLITRRPAAK